MVFDGVFLDKAKAAEWAGKFDLNLMSQEEFEQIVKGWNLLDPCVGPDPIDMSDLAPEYRELRDVIVSAWKSAGGLKSKNSVAMYAVDLEVGLALYEFLSENGFNEIYAETDDWWRFVSVKLCPDMTYVRYPQEEIGKPRINKKRFYDHTRRIWLKTLWWYVHLCWQGSIEATENVLKKLGTDAIGQIIERPGRGYRQDVFHVIAAKRAKETGWCDANSFKKVMARHSVYCASFEPVLFKGGVEGYADRIFAETKKWMKR